MSVLHVAPEPPISKKIRDLVGPSYTPRDIDPTRWEVDDLDIDFIDLTDIGEIGDNSFDVVMHLHVLEHIPAPLEGVFRETMRILKPRGRFVFGLPIGPGISFENTWPYATKQQRKARFGQHDHVRLVGREDFPLFLKDVLSPWSDQPEYRVDPKSLWDIDDFENKTGIPYERVVGYTGATIFSAEKTKNPS